MGNREWGTGNVPIKINYFVYSGFQLGAIQAQPHPSPSTPLRYFGEGKGVRFNVYSTQPKFAI